MIGYIPARGGSKRVPRKNVRELGGRPIIEHTISRVLDVPSIEQVFVSTDDPEIARVAQAAGAEWLGPRAPELSDDKAGFIDLMHDDLPRHCEKASGDNEVLFVLATAALLRSEIIEDAAQVWRKSDVDILMSVVPYTKSPYWALVPDDRGYLKPLFPDKVRINSQDLPPAYTDAGLFYIFDQVRMQNFDSHKDVDCLLPFEIPEGYGVDIDTPEDWAVMENMFRAQTG